MNDLDLAREPDLGDSLTRLSRLSELSAGDPQGQIGDLPSPSAPPAWLTRAVLGLERGSALALLVSLGWTLGAVLSEAPFAAPGRSALLAAALWLLSRTFGVSLRWRWGDPTRLALVFFLAAAAVVSVATWPNPSELAASEGPGWLGLWLLVGSRGLRLPRWAGLAGLLCAWGALGARGLAQGGTPELLALLLSSSGVLVCALISGVVPSPEPRS